MSNPTSAAGRIKAQLKIKLEALPAVQKVYGYEEVKPEGWPAVFITASNLTGEFATSAENSRTYGFRILVLFPIGKNLVPDSESNRLEYAEDVVQSVLDEIINTMDTDFELDNSDPTVLFMNPADLVWGTYSYEGGVAKAAEVTLNIYTEITVV